MHMHMQGGQRREARLRMHKRTKRKGVFCVCVGGGMGGGGLMSHGPSASQHRGTNCILCMRCWWLMTLALPATLPPAPYAAGW